LQGNIFEVSAQQIYDEAEKLLAITLEESKDKEIRAIFESYNKEAIEIESGQINLFGDVLSKAELLKLILSNYGQAERTQQNKSSSKSNGQSERNRSGQQGKQGEPGQPSSEQGTARSR